MKNSPVLRRLTAFLFGFIFLFVMLEAAIRIVGAFFHHPLSEKTDTAKSFRVLMVGNSHTFGVGVQRNQTYSAVLQDFFAREAPGINVQVFNEGIMNGNTRFVLAHLEDFLAVYQPHVTVVLSGEPNIWNKYGYTDYLRNLGKPVDAVYSIKDVLSYSRVFRWLLALDELKPSEPELTEDRKNELEAYRILARYERDPFYEFYDKQVPEIYNVLSRFVQRHKNDPPAGWRTFLYLLARLEYEHQKHPEKALELFRSSVLWKPDTFDFFTYQYLRKKAVPGSEEVLRLMDKIYPGDETYHLWERAGTVDVDLILNHQAFLEEASETFPERTRIAFLLTQIYKKNPLKKVKLFARTIDANPLQSSMAEIFDMEKIVSSDPQEQKEMQDIFLKTRKRFVERLPSEEMIFNETSQEILSRWIRYDLEKMRMIVNGSRSYVCFLNYHHLNNPGLEEQIQRPIREVAKASRCGLMDLHSVFQKEMRAPATGKSLFASKFYVKDNHPGVDGHKIIARVIYDHLKEKKLLPETLRNLDSRKIYTLITDEKEKGP